MSFKIDEQSTLEFEYKQLLGRGRTSEVHLAVCTENPDLKVAIKHNRSDHKHVDEWRQNVEREISVLRELNTAESADWSLETTLRNRITSADNSRDSRSIVQLLSIFDIDGVPALALEVAPPSITEQTLDHYDLVDAMFQIAQATELAHSRGMALTDIAPKSKASRIRWDHDLKQIKIIDWHLTRETEDYRRRDLVFLGRIFFQLLTGYPTWEKAEPPVDYLPDRYNAYALDITGATIDDWIDVEIAIRDVIERLMYQDISDAINSSETLVSAMTTLKELSDLAKRIVNGSSQATNELETMLQEVSNSRTLQLREIATIGDYFLRVAPKNRTENYEPQILSAGNLLRTAYLNSINQTIEYFNQARYGDAVAELENARSRFISNHQLTNAANYRYIVASIGEELQRNNALPNADIKELIDTLQDMVVGLESRLWDTRKAEILRDDIRTKYDSNIVNMPDMQALFQDIDASQQYREQIKRINESQRQALIDDESWTTQEAQRIAQYDSVIIPALQSIAKQSLIEKRIDAYIERIQQNILMDQQDLRTVEKFLGELRDGATNIDIEQLLEDATQKRPYTPIRISRKLLPKDQSELSSDANASQAIKRYQTFRQKWDKIMQTSLDVEDKLGRLSELINESQDVITTFREQLPTVTIPGKNNQRKTVYRDLEDLTQFIKAVNFVYDELGSIGINRIPNINKIQQNWVYVTNVQDEDLKQFVSSIQANLAAHTNDRAQAKQIPPELSMLVYEILDVPIPSSVMQIGQEIQLQSYIRTTLNQAKQLLTDGDAVATIISELSQRKVWGNDELNESLDQLVHKLDQLKAALISRTIVRQIRTLYQISKRKITSDNAVIDELSNAIDEAVESLINTRIKQIEKALDKAKTSKPMDREEEVLVHDAQRVLDTLRHNNRLQERRWHHVQNSQAFLLREYTQTIEKATTSFNSYNYSESRKHIDRAFYLANLFDMPSDKRLSEELRTAEDMVQQLNTHFTLTRDVETVHLEDIEKFVQDEISFWEKLHDIIESLESPPSDTSDVTVDISFDPQSLDYLIDALKKALTVTETMHRIRQAVEHLRDLEQMINSHHLELLKPLSSRLREILLYLYTQTLNQNITELEQIASGSRVISNESVIKRVSEGYELVKMNKSLQILDETDINQRQQQLKNNSYTALKNMKLKNQDERQALADFIDNLLTEQDIRSRDFQAVLLRLADDPNSYAYLLEQVHNHKLPSINVNNSRNMRSIFIAVSVISIMIVVVGVYLSQNPALLDEFIR